MFRKINLNELDTVKSFVALVIICRVALCNADENIKNPVVSRTSGLNVLFNMFGMPTYQDHSFTSVLDTSEISTKLFGWFKSATRRCVSFFNHAKIFRTSSGFWKFLTLNMILRAQIYSQFS